jgi:hypothetical protein
MKAGVHFLWIALLVLAAAAAVWMLLIIAWAVLLWRMVISGALHSWDDLRLEDAELRPFAARRRFRLARRK